ncbi:MAG TPA: hypothetical protein VGD98_06220 [Ktedonobacteraceae bacterium]
MVNQPDQDIQGGHTPARKLVLPEPPDAGQNRQHYSSSHSGLPISQLASTAYHGLFTHMKRRLRTDRAFALLSIAIVLVLISSLVFVSVGAAALLANSNGPVWNSAMTEHPVLPPPEGTLDVKPKFPTPVSNKGSSASSQPGEVPTPDLQPTPTNTGDQGTLNVQINNLPDVVTNQTHVQVEVQTSEPNVQIRLDVTYETAPFFYTSGGGNTDDNGNGTLNWSVRVFSFSNGNNVQATVVVVAVDQNGQQATSQPVIVEITN